MELIRGLHNLRPRHRGCVVTVGAFDGVHRGHQAVIRHLQAKAAELELPSVVMVFEPLPREYFAPRTAPARLMSFREKFRALRDLGVNRLLRVRFNEQLRSMSAQAFVEDVFVKGLGVRYVVLGDDFRFGKEREGDLEFMRDQGEQHGYEAGPTPTLAIAGERVSSTRIRHALEQGQFALAEELLGKPYSISGRVVYGRQLGREMGAPTANVELNRLRSPLSGVFAVEVSGGGLVKAPGVANVGVRPTVDDSIRANLEVHLLDREADLYGRRIEVTFLHKLREEMKFDSLEILRATIAGDIDSTRSWFAGRNTTSC
jgi:riboflavin kinase/FMN adenylyltransferase